MTAKPTAVKETEKRYLSLGQAYKQTFPDDHVFAQAVLTDLAEFCRANESTYHADSRMSDILIGRREVWLRLQKFLNLSPEELKLLALSSIRSYDRR